MAIYTITLRIRDLLSPPFGQTARLVFQHDAGSIELLSNGIGAREIPALLGGIALVHQRIYI